MKLKQFYRAIRVLKKALKFEHPLSIRRVKMPKTAAGDCWLHKKKFHIRIDRTLPTFYALDIFIHEAAHALSWFAKDDDDHGPAWGKAYAKIYRSFLDHWDEIFS